MMPPVQFSRLAETSAALATTRSRLVKRDLIAALLRATEPQDMEVVVAYLGGNLRQRRTGVGWRTLQEAAPPAAAPTLTVVEVDAAFAAVAALAGPGSGTARTAAVRDLLGRATAQEQRLIGGLVAGELRQGALEAQVQEGLATAFEVPVAAVRRAAMLTSSTTTAAVLLAAGGRAALDAVRLRVGTGVQPMLAAAAPSPEEAVERSGLPAVVDVKLDGVRVQVHRDGDEVTVFTRSLDDITARLPDVVAVARSLPRTRLVLDGEVLALRADGTPEAFQVVASRTMSAADPQAGGSPLRVFFFDLLHVDGRDLLDEPLQERLAVMEMVVPAALRVPRRTCDGAAAVAAAFAEAVQQGYEGIVVKNPGAPYAAGRRDAGWVKVKPRHTFDLAVVAAEWGHGRRQGWLSNLHLAARDPETGGFVMLGKTFKGLTDELLAWQTEQLLAREARRTPGTVHVDPPLVVEIAVDGLQASTRYAGGVALRFARVLRYRTDKSPDEVETLATVRALGGPLRAPEE